MKCVALINEVLVEWKTVIIQGWIFKETLKVECLFLFKRTEFYRGVFCDKRWQ